MAQFEVYLLRGQFDRAFSEGIDYLAAEINKLPGGRAWVWNWHEWEATRAFIDTRACHNKFGAGYSMGGNALDWILQGVQDQEGRTAHGLQKAHLRYGWFLDPTRLSVLMPLTHDHLTAATHFQNHSIDPWGHGELRGISPHFQDLEVKPLHTEHLLVDKLPSVHVDVLALLHIVSREEEPVA